MIDVLNVKCDPLLISTLRNEKGVYPAYHMNKENWVTLALDGSIKDDQLKWSLDQSFELTASKNKKKQNHGLTKGEYSFYQIQHIADMATRIIHLHGRSAYDQKVKK